MIVSDFLKTVAIRLGDEARDSYGNKELISALNDGITQLSLGTHSGKRCHNGQRKYQSPPGTTATCHLSGLLVKRVYIRSMGNSHVA